MEKKIHALPLLIFLAVVFYFVVVRARPVEAGTFSNSFAVAATFVIGFTLLLGSLSRLKPQIFTDKLKFRKPLGLWGFLFGAIHGLAAFGLEYNFNIFYALSSDNPDKYAAFAGILAIIIFTLMAATSTNNSIKRLGYEKWKTLQRTGYLAFIFVLIHFALVSEGMFITRQLGQVLLVFALIVLFARIVVLFMKKKAAYTEKNFHEVHNIEK